jgi:Tol biopolymer transport system component
LLPLAGGCGKDSPFAPDPPTQTPGGTTPTIDARIAFVSDRDGSRAIYVATADGIQVQRLTPGEHPAWSPDGSRIAFSQGYRVHMINADGSGLRALTNGIRPTWSPDGTRLAYYNNGSIFLMNTDGTGVIRLIDGEMPAWSPAGQLIAFVRTSTDEFEPWLLYVINPDGGEPREITFIDSNPVWSPDGSWIAFTYNRTVSIVDADGSGRRQIAEGFDADWSPDGRSLIFEKFSGPPDGTNPIGSRMRIFIADAQGGSERQLIPDAVAPALANYWDQMPAWSRRR